MSQNLTADNFGSSNILSTTFLAADIDSGVETLPVLNSNDFSSGGYVLVGAPGSQSPEILTATTPSQSNAIPTSSSTTLPHNNNDPVNLLFGNQIKVYSASDVAGNGTAPPDANFSEINGSPFTINANQTTTAFTDPDGTSGMWYKFTYYNSTTGSETDIAEAIASQTGQTHYVSLDDIRSAAFGSADSHNVTNSKIAEFRDAAEKEVNGALLPVYAFPLPIPTNPLVVQITKNIAAGELKREMYEGVSESMKKGGQDLAEKARKGGGSHTPLSDLVDRTVVMEDANFLELTIEEAHAFGGWPDETTEGAPYEEGGDHGPQFRTTEIY